MIKSKAQNIYTIIFPAIVVIIMCGVTHALETKEEAVKFFVYIDPSFGDKENGPILLNKYASKDVALGMGKNLRRVLESKGIVVALSRNDDVYVPLPDRISQVKTIGADVYINIHISLSNNSCIRIYLPKGKRKYRKVEGLNTINEGLSELARIDDSTKFAHMIEHNLSKNVSSFCGGIKSRHLANLDKIYCPAIMLDFSVAKTDAHPYVLDPSFMNEVFNAVAKGVADYIAEIHKKQ